jgi:hypothetical protein
VYWPDLYRHAARRSGTHPTIHDDLRLGPVRSHLRVRAGGDMTISGSVLMGARW